MRAGRRDVARGSSDSKGVLVGAEASRQHVLQLRHKNDVVPLDHISPIIVAGAQPHLPVDL